MKRILLTGDVTEKHLQARVSYAQALRQAGAISVAGFAWTESEARTLAQTMDALLVTGGDDVDPALYGEACHPQNSLAGADRDRSDRLLMEAFRAEGKRVLGICRGCQIMNVCLGGSLMQHVPERTNCAHPGNCEGKGHSVFIEGGSRLASLLWAGEGLVNSYHHQAIDRPGAGLKVTARAADGIIEAAEGEGMLLIQWHPELMDASMLPLFQWVCAEDTAT